MPAVAVRRRPNGLPIATTVSPTRMLSEFPKQAGRARVKSTARGGRRCRSRVAADERRPQRVLVREADLDVVGPLDHVVVRDDVAGLVDHEAGAERLPRHGLLVGRRERRVVRRRRRRRDLHDAGRGARVDLADRHAAVIGDRGGGCGSRGGSHHGRRAAAEVAGHGTPPSAIRPPRREAAPSAAARMTESRVSPHRCIREVLTAGVKLVKSQLRGVGCLGVGIRRARRQGIRPGSGRGTGGTGSGSVPMRALPSAPPPRVRCRAPRRASPAAHRSRTAPRRCRRRRRARP